MQVTPVGPARSPEAGQARVDHDAEVGDATLLPTADSRSTGSNVEVEPRVLMPCIGGVGPYRERCQEIAADGHEGLLLDGAPGGAVAPGRVPAARLIVLPRAGWRGVRAVR